MSMNIYMKKSNTIKKYKSKGGYVLKNTSIKRSLILTKGMKKSNDYKKSKNTTHSSKRRSNKFNSKSSS